MDAFEKRIAKGNHLKHKTHRKFFIYISIYLFTWIPPTIEIVVNNLNYQPTNHFVLSCIGILSSRLHGFVSALMYAFNRRFRRLLNDAMKNVRTAT